MFIIVNGSSDTDPCNGVNHAITSIMTSDDERYKYRICFLDHRVDTRTSIVDLLLEPPSEIDDLDYTYTIGDCTRLKADSLIDEIKKPKSDPYRVSIVYFDLDSLAFQSRDAMTKYLGCLCAVTDSKTHVICLNTIRDLGADALELFDRHVLLKNTSWIAIAAMIDAFKEYRNAKMLETILPYLNSSSSHLDLEEYDEQDSVDYGIIIIDL